MKKYQFFVLLFFAFFSLILGKNCLAISQSDIFNPNYIADEDDFLRSGTMSSAEIQSFLTARGGFLATYRCDDGSGNQILASEAIYRVSVNNGVNPRFILVLLEKEQSLLTSTSPRQSQLDWATGYGCPDGGGCNERWRGFYKQINSASLQFKDYLENPQYYKYQVGQSYTISNTGKDPIVVTPVNKATAALYNYTPHVYNGNYNFWKLWRKFFKREGYPDGSLLQVKGEAGVWLIQDNKKRPFISRGALISRFDPKKIITIQKSDLDKYTLGAPIKFPQYAIVKAPDKKLYLLVGDKKRLFATADAFKKIGYNPEEIISATAEEINAYQDGKQITASDVYPTGALLKDKKTAEIFWVEEGTKAPVIDPIFLKIKFKNKKPIIASSEALAKYQTIAPIRFDSGELVRLDGGFMNYVVEGLTIRPIASDEDFKALGYKWSNVITISPQVLMLYTVGDILKAPATATSEPVVIDTTTAPVATSTTL
jgi:hypothetical protein